MKLARRYECTYYWREGYPHLKGDGSPRRRKCRCGGELRIEEGLWGVFKFDPTNRNYLLAYAVGHLYMTYKAADECADRLTRHGEPVPGGYVTRWIPASWLPGS